MIGPIIAGIGFGDLSEKMLEKEPPITRERMEEMLMDENMEEIEGLEGVDEDVDYSLMLDEE